MGGKIIFLYENIGGISPIILKKGKFNNLVDQFFLPRFYIYIIYSNLFIEPDYFIFIVNFL